MISMASNEHRSSKHCPAASSLRSTDDWARPHEAHGAATPLELMFDLTFATASGLAATPHIEECRVLARRISEVTGWDVEQEVNSLF